MSAEPARTAFSSTIIRSCATACARASKPCRVSRVIGEAGNAKEALALAADEANPPDLVLMDVGMNGMSGIELAALFHERFPGIRVLMLSMHDNLEYVKQAVRAGASGYVLKDSPATEIIQAIDAVLAGKTFFSAGLGARA